MLTDEQYREIAATVEGTWGSNAYQIAKDRYGHQWTDDDFDKLATVGGVFRCEECNAWLDTCERSSPESRTCADCMRQFDDDGDE